MSRVDVFSMARERFLKSDLDAGLGVEGKRPRDAKASVDEEADRPLAQEGRPSPEKQGQQEKGKKKKSFDRLSINEKDDSDIFR
ncbi:hypothetical protein [Methanogenium organophilum]|uniref:Uncharacterized protein n=1 Tax=Methanogenium organophilum TaxID=2199 RepID=A0A9X9T776_METOG|nr:hypothetical protein [Methanogenium organophilum]WAI00146.1 hypothetical protein OU421_06800 [Methanogenium organophilum]